MIKLTKTELRDQQVKLERLKKYLPTLQLKKSLLQMEVLQAVLELEKARKEWETLYSRAEDFAHLLTHPRAKDLLQALKVDAVATTQENIAGVEVPLFEKVVFAEPTYMLFDTPLWMESAMHVLQNMLSAKEHMRVITRKKEALEKELREVSIRVNLFEKVLIPRCQRDIKRIKIFLGDQQLAAVAQAKVAKLKKERV